MSGLADKQQYIRVGKNSLSLMLVQASNVLIPLLVLPYLARTLGVDGFGVVAMVFAFTQAIFVFTDYGFSLSAVRQIAQLKSAVTISTLVSSIYLAKLVLTGAALIVLIGFGNFYQAGQYFDVFMWGGLIVVSQAYQPVWYFQGIERMLNIAVYILISRLLYIVLVFVWVKSSADLVLVIVSFGLSQLLASAVSNLLMYKKDIRLCWPALAEIIKSLRESTGFFVSRLAVTAYTSANTVVVGAISGIQQAAFYNAGEQVYRVGQALHSPVNLALYPYLSNSRDHRMFQRLTWMLGCIIIALAIIVVWYREAIVSLIFGSEFELVAPLLEVFMIVTVVNFFGSFFGYCAFTLINRMDIANRSVVIGFAVQMILITVLWLTGQVSAINVVIALLITESVVLFYRLRQFYRYRPFS